MDLIWFFLRLQFYLTIAYTVKKIIDIVKNEIMINHIESKLPSGMMKFVLNHPESANIMHVIRLLDAQNLLTDPKINSSINLLLEHANPKILAKSIDKFFRFRFLNAKNFQILLHHPKIEEIDQAIHEMSCIPGFFQIHMPFILKHSHPIVFSRALIKLEYFHAYPKPSANDLFLLPHSPLELMHALQILAKENMLNAMTLSVSLNQNRVFEWAQAMIKLKKFRLIPYIPLNLLIHHTDLLQMSKILTYLKQHELLTHHLLQITLKHPQPLYVGLLINFFKTHQVLDKNLILTILSTKETKEIFHIFKKLKVFAMFDLRYYEEILVFENPALLYQAIKYLIDYQLLSPGSLKICLNQAYSIRLFEAIEICAKYQILNQQNWNFISRHTYPKHLASILVKVSSLEALDSHHLQLIFSYFDTPKLASTINIILSHCELNTHLLLKLLHSEKVPDILYLLELLLKDKYLNHDNCLQIIEHPTPHLLTLPLDTLSSNKLLNPNNLALILEHQNILALDAILDSLDNLNLLTKALIDIILYNPNLLIIINTQKSLESEGLLTSILMESLIYHPHPEFFISCMTYLKTAKLLTHVNLWKILNHPQTNYLQASLEQFFYPLVELKRAHQANLDLILQHHPVVLDKTTKQMLRLNPLVINTILSICTQTQLNPQKKAKKIQLLPQLETSEIYLANLDQMDLNALFRYHSFKQLQEFVYAMEPINHLPTKETTYIRIFGLKALQHLILVNIFNDYLKKYGVFLAPAQKNIIYQSLNLMIGQHLHPKQLKQIGATMLRHKIEDYSLSKQKQSARFFSSRLVKQKMSEEMQEKFDRNYGLVVRK